MSAPARPAGPSALSVTVDAVCRAVRDEPGDLEHLVDAAVRRLAPLTDASDRRAIRTASIARLAGLGELESLVADPGIDEVLVHGDRIWIDRGGRLEAHGRLTATTVEQVVERILAPIGRRVDRTSPIVDARLANGSRVCAVVPPVSVGATTLSIRRFAPEVRPLADFADDDGVDLLTGLVARRCNVVVCGATSSGKTSLLSALLARAGSTERLVVVEDTAELPCGADHLVRLEARPASADGLAAVTVADLVRTALRLRPDRLVVGEVRGDEVLGLVQAMSTGHDGSCSTVHANGPLDALLRLESLVLQAAPAWPLVAVRHQLARSIDVVVHVARVGGRRRVVEVAEVVEPTNDGPATPSTRPLAALDDGRLRAVAELRRWRR